VEDLLPTPTKFTLVAGSAEGPSRLNAFDNALLAAGIGNLNLLKVSSILPPGCQKVEKLDIPPGSLTPTAYGIGFSADSYGVIMEYSGSCSKEEAEKTVEQMVRAAFVERGVPLVKVETQATDHVVQENGCAFAAVALWY
jgi:arginine decarboxylase